ncbi:MAG: hypothetical protein RLZZ574_2373 [Cyanobacteriota bacterium]|jgi:hypothetical protein
MFSNRKILLICSVVFFAACIALITHLFFSPPNSDTKGAITIYFLIYGGLFSAFEIFKHRNEPTYGISPSRAVGAALGFVSGFYCSYLICILVGISDGISLMESSSITIGICMGSGEAGRQIGSFFGNILLPT